MRRPHLLELIILEVLLLVVMVLLLAGCDDRSGPEARITQVHVVRTDGPRDISEQWAKLEERPQPNGDMWTSWALIHADRVEVRWEHRQGLSTRFVPREEVVPQ